MVFSADFSHQISHKHTEQLFVISGIQYSCGMNNINIHCGRASATKISKQNWQMQTSLFKLRLLWKAILMQNSRWEL